jgi:hypothetical protein
MAKLPITLEAGTADGILAKTNAIKDETQNKFQHDINAEVIAGINTLDENTFKKTGGKIIGDVTIADNTDDVVEIDAQGITLRDTSDDTQVQTRITHARVESTSFKIKNATADNPQVLLAHGVVMEIMKDSDVEQAIAAAWGS